MRVLAVDIGTNSTLHLIADVTGGNVNLVERGIVENHLGAGVQTSGRLSGELIAANREIISDLVTHGKNRACERFGGVGTHALRKAVNRDEFTKSAWSAGLPVRVISDEEEATLAWRGVFGAGGPDTISGLIDIGGGSSEFIKGKGPAIHEFSSISIGAVNAVFAHFRHDPPLITEVDELEEVVRAGFGVWKDRLPAGAELVGIAGTVTGIAAIEMGIDSFTPGIIEGLSLDLKRIKWWKDELLRMDISQRRKTVCVQRKMAKDTHPP